MKCELCPNILSKICFLSLHEFECDQPFCNIGNSRTLGVLIKLGIKDFKIRFVIENLKTSFFVSFFTEYTNLNCDFDKEL